MLTVFILFYKFIVPLGFLQWEIGVAVPRERQLRRVALHNLQGMLFFLCVFFWCCHNPLNSEMDHKIWNMHMWSFCMHRHMAGGGGWGWGPQPIISFKGPRDFCGVQSLHRMLTPGNLHKGDTQNLAWNSHPSTGGPCLIVLNQVRWE